MSFPIELPQLLPRVLPGWGETFSLQGGSDGTLHALSSHAQAAYNLILQQYKESPRLLAMLQSYLDRVQEIDTVIARLYQFGLSLEYAAGDQLDLLGLRVREARDGRGDDLYRLALRVRILINLSNGSIPQLIEIAALFENVALESGAYVRVMDRPPGSVEVRLDVTPTNTPRRVNVRLQRAKAGGVRLHTIVFPGDRTIAFRLIRASAYPEKNIVSGLAAVSAGIKGGFFAHVLSS